MERRRSIVVAAAVAVIGGIQHGRIPLVRSVVEQTDAKFRTAALKIGGGNVATFRRENYAHQTSRAKSRFGNISTKVQGQFWKNFSTRKKTDTWVMSRNHCQFSTLFQSLHNHDLPRDLPPDDEFALRSREDLL